MFIGSGLYGQKEVIVVKYDIPHPKPEKVKLATDKSGKKFVTYDRIRLEGARISGKPGEPALPRLTSRILLPPGYKIKSVKVTTGKAIRLKGKFLIEPGQVVVPASENTFTHTPPNPGIYKSGRPFPKAIYSSPTYHNFRGFNIAIIEYIPFKYKPANQVLFYFKRIKFSLKLAKRKQTDKSLLRKKESDFEKIKTMIDNPEILKFYKKKMELLKLQPTALPPGNWDMVIVTNGSLTPTFQSYANWRTNSRGIRTIVYDIATILSSYNTGYDDAENLRNFIIDAYYTWGIEYVLLGGDIDIVPYRLLYCEGGGGEDIPADIYFAGLDGTWDSNNNHVYGERIINDEADLIGDVYVGRGPVNTATEAQNFCSKIRSYEESNLNAYRCNWLFFATKLSNVTYGGYYKDDTESQELPPGHNFNITKVYQYLGGNSTQVINNLNSGQRIGNSCGHGGTTNFGMINSTDVYTLTNTNYHLIYTWACWTNAFDQSDCIGEHFLYTNHGAFGFIGNSRYGWFCDSGDDSIGPSHDFELEFYDALMDEEIPRLGIALQDSKEEFSGSSAWYDRWITYGLNLMGDPSTLLRIKNDIWIKTGTNDDGSLPAPSPFWNSQDIVVDSPTNGWSPPSPFPTHENPEFGSTNRVYIRVRNLGCEDANNVTVRLYWADPSAGIPWPPGWNFIGENTISTIPNNGVEVTSINWTPTGTAFGHRCLLATIECNTDPISIHNPIWDNNVAQKNVNIVNLDPPIPPGSPFKHELQFFINPTNTRALRKLMIESINAPANTKFELFIPQTVEIKKRKSDTHITMINKGRQKVWLVIGKSSANTENYKIHDLVVPDFHCKKKEKISLIISLPPNLREEIVRYDRKSGKKRPFIVRITEEMDGDVIGGVDYLFRYKK